MANTNGIANRKNSAVEQLDAFKGGSSYNIIAPKPTVEDVVEQNDSVGGDKDSGWNLGKIFHRENARVYWTALAISVAVVLVFILAVKQRWVKL